MSGEKLNISLSVHRSEIIEALADGSTHEQIINMIMDLDLHMADMEGSIEVLERMFSSLKSELEAGEVSEKEVARYNELTKELIDIIKQPF